MFKSLPILLNIQIEGLLVSKTWLTKAHSIAYTLRITLPAIFFPLWPILVQDLDRPKKVGQKYTYDLFFFFNLIKALLSFSFAKGVQYTKFSGPGD